MTDRRYLGALRTMGKIEGTSTLVLFFIAMPLKYLAGLPVAVTIAGSIHGMLFLTLVWMFYRAVDRVPIPRSLALKGVIAAVVPFGPFVLDRQLADVGRAATPVPVCHPPP
jgi:integral membrane protein